MALSVIISGNPIDGFKVFGPYKHEIAATEAAEELIDDYDWWVAPLEELTGEQHGSSS